MAALFSPGDEATPVSWSTDKTGIVELQEVPGQPNQKRVVAKAPGRATITAATAGGLLSDSCVVTVYQIGDGSGSGEDITVKPPDNPADGSYQYVVNGRLVLYTNGTPNSANLSGSISVTPSPPSPPQPAWASGNPGVAAVAVYKRQVRGRLQNKFRGGRRGPARGLRNLPQAALNLQIYCAVRE